MAAPGTPCTISLSMSTQEVSVVPGESVDIYMILDDLDGVVNGFQAQYIMKDVAGNPIDDSNGAVTIKRVSRKYWQNVGTFFPGAAHGQSIPEVGTYRILGTNSEANIYWCSTDQPDWDYEAPQLPENAFKFTIQTTAEWDEEYATMDFDETYYKFSTGYINDEGMGQPDGSYVMADMGALAQLDVVIKNANYGQQDKTPFEAEITIGDLDGNQVPVSYTSNDDAAVVTVTVNGEAVNVEFVNGAGVVTLPDYGEYTIVVTAAVGNADAYEGEDVTETKTVNYAQPVAADPVITFVPNADGSVTVNVDPYTSVAIHVNGYEENYYEAPVTIEQGYAEKVITVEAVNAPAGYVASATVNDEYTLTAKEKETAAAPTFSVETTDDEVIITVIPDPNTDGELVILDEDGDEITTNPIHVARGENDATFTFTAYTAEGDTYKQSPFLLNQEVEIPAKYVDPGKTPEPTVTVTEEALYYTVTAVGEGTVHLLVETNHGRAIFEDEGEGEAEVVLPRYEEENPYQIVRVEAWAINPPKAASDLVVLTEDPEVNVDVDPIAKAPSSEPTFRVVYNDETVEIWAEGDGEVVMIDPVTGEPLLNPDGTNTNPVIFNRPAYGEDPYVAFAAATNTDNGWYEPTRADFSVQIPAQLEKVYETPAPTVTAVQDDENMVITATGQGTVTLYVTVYDPVTGAPTTYTATGDGTATYSVARGEDDVMISYYATAEAAVPEGYDSVLPGASQAQTEWVDKVELDPCAAPTIDAGQGDWGADKGHIAIYNNEPGATVHYVIYKDGVVYKSGEFTGDELNREIVGEGTYTVEAYATKQGMAQSTTTTFTYEFVPGDPTAVNELVNGKTIAGVRYFNMAGQEMKEANGVTIVVTTYTDGTTSTVKVVK